MSAIGWIDFDEAERERAQRLMQLFTERDTRDELGLGAIRDSIADHLFPGTSTVQTRLRYMLFVPWIFSQLTARSDAREVAEQARTDQIRLRNALVAGMQDNGVIGVNAGSKLKRLPASVYWSGLHTWGIRRFPGSIEAYAASLPTWSRAVAKDHADDDHSADRTQSTPWHPRLPEAPADLLQVATFALTDEEAAFIVDRLVDSNPDSLLAFLASRDGRADADDIWTHPHVADFPSVSRRIVAHAEIFSDAMYGASLLYNLMLSERRGNADWVGRYEDQLAQWRQSFDAARLQNWSLDIFWQETGHPAHQVLEPTRRFVSEWVELLRATRGLGRDRRKADAMVETRERRLKKGQSRFANRAARDRWQGSSGAYRLQFRWSQARRHLDDLARG
ncbi:DUF6361 family protein [Methylobacterium sp. Leaf88]|uniref:DUF6361 family protein n=1 Tax=Methylobacterium sp. Leaf88 TaxID=1736244 RepID=UPI0006F32ED0|nr:DUF6361 family protein [Methylobacterium sp. Leaf88]KQO77869.1 hypothetical protein ASF20_12910 [Methylobacterium sp. Leaf88]